jgi:hypothetical protein
VHPNATLHADVGVHHGTLNVHVRTRLHGRSVVNLHSSPRGPQWSLQLVSHVCARQFGWG